ncbi:ABC transporter permease [Luedemannella helvata]|uniref:ABC transporter permease n=1 Tax=Luedemannella helvata TaxID=349315 RepID=A0ABP4VT38_9ACTN
MTETTPSLGRLTVVELRKLVDTRSGRWLLITIAVLAAVVATLQAIFSEPGDRTFANFYLVSVFPVALLLPVLGILLVTSEWSQRTALTTFTLVPKRHRVAAAKVTVAVIASVVAVPASLAVATVATAASSGEWTFHAQLLWGAALAHAIGVLMGVGFGMLLLNSPLAIVVYLILPTLWTILGATIRSLNTVAQWLDTTITTAPLFEPEMTGGQWARLGVSVAVWALLPLVAGMIRINMREVA